MAENTGTPRLEITYDRDELGDGVREVQGRFLDRPGWTFHASVDPGIAWDTDAITDYRCTRLHSYGISKEGGESLCEPDYDDDYRFRTAEHDAMLDEVDRFFGPSVQERERLCAERRTERTSVRSAITKLIDERFPDADPRIVAGAASEVRKVYRDRAEECREAGAEREVVSLGGRRAAMQHRHSQDREM